jgi:orotidine-5'-phosphate decarboxylase
VSSKPASTENPSFQRTAVVPVAEQLIVALDFPDARAALSLVDRLEGATRWFKIGLELYIAEGNALVAELERRGYSIFLDLKLHDIPNTVASAVRAASRLGVNLLTIHAAGGADMLQAAVAAARGIERSPALLAVTVLTSIDRGQLEATGVPGSLSQQVERLAKLALSCGVQGLVCSPHEVAGLRREIGNKPLLVVPGIRPAGSAAGDQRRVATPASAVAAGASYLVVGRPITQAEDPGAAARAILAEMQTAV